MATKVTNKKTRKKTANVNVKRTRTKKPLMNNKLFKEFISEFTTTELTNTICVSHNLTLENKLMFAGHIAEMPKDRHVIQNKMRDGRIVQFNVNMVFDKLKTVKVTDTD